MKTTLGVDISLDIAGLESTPSLALPTTTSQSLVVNEQAIT